MAVLGDSDREDIWRIYMEFSSDIREEIGLTKAEVRAAVNDTDDWIESNKVSFNTSLSSAVQSALTAKQKARLFMEVGKRKFEVEV